MKNRAITAEIIVRRVYVPSAIKLWTSVLLISTLETVQQWDAINFVIQIEHKHSPYAFITTAHVIIL